MYYIYLIRNENNKKYIGQTEDLEKRLLRHNGINKNKRSSYTSKNKGIWKIVYTETYNTRTEAIKREKFLKSHKGRDWLKLKLGP